MPRTILDIVLTTTSHNTHSNISTARLGTPVYFSGQGKPDSSKETVVAQIMLRKYLALRAFLGGALEEVELSSRCPLHGPSLGSSGGRRLQQSEEKQYGRQRGKGAYLGWVGEHLAWFDVVFSTEQSKTGQHHTARLINRECAPITKRTSKLRHVDSFP